MALAGCTRDGSASYSGGWVGVSHERGHRLRAPKSERPSRAAEPKSGSLPLPARRRDAQALIIGAGIAGLAAARALLRAGIDDVHVLELEDSPGGNSRGHRIAGIDCPLGAHYLPLPGPHAHEVAEWLDELGLARVEHGRVRYDERHLCHSPQERLYIDGRWQDGLLPQADDDAKLAAQYRAFGAAVEALRGQLAFALPSARAAWSGAHDALDRITFAHWLDAQGFDHPRLRWYLDYCCRDDYGAGAVQVSAWAGMHYFASRHGFRPPGDEDAERDAVLTWPEGNAWLAARLAAPLGERLHAGRVALAVAEGRHRVEVDAWNARDEQVERWSARCVVLAVPLFVAARLLDAPPAALVDATARLRYAAWLVANLHLERPLADRLGAPLAWDNVAFEGASLGYVDAMHQSTRPHAGPTVLSAYWALGADAARRLRDGSWQTWAKAVVDDLAPVHPDLARKTTRIDLMRYGHAMCIPLPGVRGSGALRALGEVPGRVQFAHSDLSAYSVFEEAFYQGQRAGERVARSLAGASA